MQINIFGKYIRKLKSYSHYFSYREKNKADITVDFETILPCFFSTHVRLVEKSTTQTRFIFVCALSVFLL